MEVTADTFKYVGAPLRVVFGHGVLGQLPPLVEELGARAVIVLSTPEQVQLAERVKDILGPTAACLFSEATMHTPLHVTERAMELVKSYAVDGIVSVGGGSTVGLGKALSTRTGLPHLCIPTTYAGSEMTPILGETENGRKVTRRDPSILPTAVLYDVEFTLTLPLKLSVHSGINAIAHAGMCTTGVSCSPARHLSFPLIQSLTADILSCTVEALYATNSNPIIDMMACEGIRSLAEALPALQEDNLDSQARHKALYGSWLCGMCLGAVDMALHHKLCHTLGGSFDLPHAQTHVILLPHALSYNAPKIPATMAKLANILPESNGDAVEGLNVLYRRLGIDLSLRGLGMSEEGIEKAAEIATANPYKNPRPLERDTLCELIRRAWSGEGARQDL